MFDLDDKAWDKITDWVREQDGLITRMGGYPPDGDIGGSLTYEFTPTAVGTIVKVKHALTNEVLDLTDYDD